MSKITLVTGGARSGKSSFAEKLLEASDDVLYIATAVRTDDEMAQRIAHHIRTRNQKWTTHEGFRDLDAAVSEHKKPYILLDCVTNMISNLIYYNPQDPEQLSRAETQALYETIRTEFEKLLDRVIIEDRNLILVSNEVGMGLTSEYKLGRLFVDYAGFINQYLAARADQVYFMVSGLPLTVKE